MLRSLCSMTRVPERGDLVWLQFDPQAAAEQAGHRPALVISPRSYNRPRVDVVEIDARAEDTTFVPEAVRRLVEMLSGPFLPERDVLSKVSVCAATAGGHHSAVAWLRGLETGKI